MRTPTSYPPAVLLVDDEPHVLAILRRLLRDLTKDCDIVSVADGTAALALAAQRTVPLVIVDYSLLGMNGLELTAALKAHTPEVHVVLITAHNTPELHRRAIACGVDLYLPKPFQFDALEQIVRRTLV